MNAPVFWQREVAIQRRHEKTVSLAKHSTQSKASNGCPAAKANSVSVGWFVVRTNRRRRRAGIIAQNGHAILEAASDAPRLRRIGAPPAFSRTLSSDRARRRGFLLSARH